MKLLHLTDIHLNFIPIEERMAFYQSIIDEKPTHILLTGDIGEYVPHSPDHNTADLLKELAFHVEVPVYFVLGNHDYYHASQMEVVLRMEKLSQQIENLFYLSICEPEKLDDETVIVGVDGWADAREGNYATSWIRLNDSVYIEELKMGYDAGKEALAQVMQHLADNDAAFLKENLNDAIPHNGLLLELSAHYIHPPKRIIVLTHVPPFPETALHYGVMSKPDKLPFYCSKATGDVLLEFAKKHPNIQIDVFAGHTHDHADWTHPEALNLRVRVGSAKYGAPSFKVIE